MIIAMATMAFTTVAHADALSGSVLFFGLGSATSSSLTLGTAYVNYGTDSFAGLSLFSPITVGSTVPDLSSTPLTVNIPDFLQIPDGTDQFDFTLTSITDTTPIGGTLPSFSGLGTFIDGTDPTLTAPGSFTLIFSGDTGYSVSMNTVATPEPSSWALALLCAGFFGYIRSRLVRA